MYLYSSIATQKVDLTIKFFKKPLIHLRKQQQEEEEEEEERPVEKSVEEQEKLEHCLVAEEFPTAAQALPLKPQIG